MESNGWISYDSEQWPTRDWALSLRAFEAATDAAKQASRAWPNLQKLQKVSGVRSGDRYDIFASREEAVQAATDDPDLHSIRWDYSQSDSDEFPGSNRVRSFAITAARGVGLTLYASSPNESEVASLLSAVRQAAEAAKLHSASDPAADVDGIAQPRRWRRLRTIDKIVSHPVVSGLIVAALIALIGAVSALFR